MRLPTGFFCYAPPPDAPEPGEPPVLVTGQITFGCFNNLAKVTPETIALWARILGQLPQARLIMKAHALGDAGARRDVHAHFAAGGIASGRVELFGPEESHGGHLAAVPAKWTSRSIRFPTTAPRRPARRSGWACRW